MEGPALGGTRKTRRARGSGAAGVRTHISEYPQRERLEGWRLFSLKEAVRSKSRQRTLTRMHAHTRAEACNIARDMPRIHTST